VHIPDGYLSPATCATLTAAMVPVWGLAARRAQRVVKSRYAPLMAVGAAYAFLVMMFNVPIPDGTTAHAVGAVLIAVLLGPWAATISVSTALLIQALFFGDGGVLAFGANAFNMAFVMPFVGYAVYRLLAGDAALTSPRRALAAGLGGYVGLNAAAFVAAIEFGLQPVLFHSADGTPLYAPFHLSQTIPAMALAHLTVAGFVEAALTVGVVTYLQRANLPLLRLNHPDVALTAGEVVRRPVSWRWALRRNRHPPQRHLTAAQSRTSIARVAARRCGSRRAPVPPRSSWSSSSARRRRTISTPSATTRAASPAPSMQPEAEIRPRSSRQKRC